MYFAVLNPAVLFHIETGEDCDVTKLNRSASHRFRSILGKYGSGGKWQYIKLLFAPRPFESSPVGSPSYRSVPTNKNALLAGLEGQISTHDSRLHAFVIPTDEELLIARDTVRCIQVRRTL